MTSHQSSQETTPRTETPLPSGDIIAQIGHTPLIPLHKIGQSVSPVKLFAKAEWFNPGGSIKDRAAANMIAVAEKEGLLTPEKIILDASSGNTAIALAMIGAAKGYRVKLCVPANASAQVIKSLKALGADLVLTTPLESSDGAIKEARRIAEADPKKYIYLDQYGNPANWQAHYQSTAPEIWEQTEGTITHFIAGLGTSGTMMGTTKRLKELNPAIQSIAIQPDSPLHGLEGMKHMETSIVPGIYDDSVPDQQMEIKTEDAYAMVRRLAKEEGLLAGISSGAILAAGLEVAKNLKTGTIVMIFADGGSRYLDEEFWTE